MKVKVHPFEDFEFEGERIRRVSFEFGTPSTHEVTITLDKDDRPTYGEEVAYGEWNTYEGDELRGLLGYMADHGIELRDVVLMAKRKRAYQRHATA